MQFIFMLTIDSQRHLIPQNHGSITPGLIKPRKGFLVNKRKTF